MISKNGVIITVLLITVLLTGFVGAYSPAQEAIKIEGTVYYRERILLSPDSIVKVSLMDISGRDSESTVIAEKEIKPEGQVPISFTLEINSDEISKDKFYGLRATIVSESGKINWVTPEIVSVDPFKQTEGINILLIHSIPEKEIEQSNLFNTEELFFVVQYKDDLNKVEIGMPDGERINLSKVTAASGAKYSNGDIIFWNKGNEAIIQIGNNVYNTRLEDFEGNNEQGEEDLIENIKALVEIKKVQYTNDRIQVLIDKNGQEILLNLGEETKILGSDNKHISYEELKEIKEGTKIVVEYKPYMTMSIPPQTAADKIVVLPFVKGTNNSSISIFKTEEAANDLPSLKGDTVKEDITFKAVGQEPAWSLNIIKDRY